MDENYTFETRFVSSIAWNSSGTRIAIATSDWGDTDDIYVNHCLSIIDVASGKAEITLPIGCEYIVNRIAWRNDDKEIIAISVGGEFRCFDVQSGYTLINQWNTEGLVEADFNPTGTQVALVARRLRREEPKFTDEPEILEVYDLESGTLLQSELLPLHENEITDWFGWSPDGTRLAMTNRKGNVLIYQWNGTEFSFQHEFMFAIGKVVITWGSWGSDSRHIALNTSYNRQSGIVIYDTETKEIIHQLDQSLYSIRLVWGAENNLIAARPQYPGPDYHLKVWDGTTGEIVGEGEDRYILALGWSPDGVLATGGVITYDEWLQDPTVTGVSIYRPKRLPPP